MYFSAVWAALGSNTYDFVKVLLTFLKPLIFLYKWVLFCQTKFKRKNMISKSNGILLVLLTFVNYDSIVISKSMIFHYKCALFWRTRFQHTWLMQKKSFKWFWQQFNNKTRWFQAVFENACKFALDCFLSNVRSKLRSIDFTLYMFKQKSGASVAAEAAALKDSGLMWAALGWSGLIWASLRWSRLCSELIYAALSRSGLLWADLSWCGLLHCGLIWATLGSNT